MNEARHYFGKQLHSRKLNEISLQLVGPVIWLHLFIWEWIVTRSYRPTHGENKDAVTYVVLYTHEMSCIKKHAVIT
jgi:hypothetical protein